MCPSLNFRCLSGKFQPGKYQRMGPWLPAKGQFSASPAGSFQKYPDFNRIANLVLLCMGMSQSYGPAPDKQELIALIGLQFVVVTLIADSPTLRVGEAVAAFATPTIVHFGVVLLLSAVVSVPWHKIEIVSVVWV
jgi:hypothetical protein